MYVYVSGVCVKTVTCMSIWTVLYVYVCGQPFMYSYVCYSRVSVDSYMCIYSPVPVCVSSCVYIESCVYIYVCVQSCAYVLLCVQSCLCTSLCVYICV